MAAPCYIIWNGATSALTAAPTPVTTGTSLKTMLQLKPARKVRIVEWGYFFDATPASAIKVELLETGTIAATVTQSASGDVAKYNDAGADATDFTLSTTGTGYTATAEGSIVASRLFSYRLETGTQWSQQFPLGREPEIAAGSICRIRVTAGTAVNMSCYIIVEE